MTTARFKTAFLLVNMLCFSPMVSAEPLSPFFSHPFDAVSVSHDAAGNMSTTHTVSDGRGHIRTETSASSAAVISIYDHASSTLSTIREKDKVILKTTIPPYLMEPGSMPKQDSKNLGKQMINGHPCVGESFHFANTNFITWRGLDVEGYTVKSMATRNGVQHVTELKSYSHNAPDPSLFVVPTEGYTIKDLASPGASAASERAPVREAPAAPQGPVPPSGF